MVAFIECLYTSIHLGSTYGTDQSY
jgi:hypothetical protein